MHLIALTAAVTPKWRVTRSDPRLRAEDYKRALTFWLGHEDPRLRNILFIENSGYDLGEFRVLPNPFNKEVEFISVPPEPFLPGIYTDRVHYGYAEMYILDAGLARSSQYRRCDYLIKATGRLVFPTLPRLLNKLPKDFLFAVDSRDNRGYTAGAQRFVTTQLMIFSRTFFENELRGGHREMRGPTTVMEVYMWEKLFPFQGKRGAILRWPVNCDPRGVAAHWDKHYGSARQRTVSAARGVCRRLFPRWWI